jgi:hypothetical protein
MGKPTSGIRRADRRHGFSKGPRVGLQRSRRDPAPRSEAWTIRRRRSWAEGVMAIPATVVVSYP